MSNMSHCRFHNTYGDLRDCLDAIDSQEISSKSEQVDATEMFEHFLEFCEEKGIIEKFDKEEIKILMDESYISED